MESQKEIIWAEATWGIKVSAWNEKRKSRSATPEGLYTLPRTWLKMVILRCPACFRCRLYVFWLEAEGVLDSQRCGMFEPVKCAASQRCVQAPRRASAIGTLNRCPCLFKIIKCFLKVWLRRLFLFVSATHWLIAYGWCYPAAANIPQWACLLIPHLLLNLQAE